MSPKDVAESFETTGFDVKEHLSRPKHEWDILYPDDPHRHLYPPYPENSLYPEGSTLQERIQMRKDRIAAKTVLIDTPWGVRPV